MQYSRASTVCLHCCLTCRCSSYLVNTAGLSSCCGRVALEGSGGVAHPLHTKFSQCYVFPRSAVALFVCVGCRSLLTTYVYVKKNCCCCGCVGACAQHLWCAKALCYCCCVVAKVGCNVIRLSKGLSRQCSNKKRKRSVCVCLVLVPHQHTGSTVGLGCH